MSTKDLLTMHLDAVVPLRIIDYQQQGGPSDLDYQRISTEYPSRIGSEGDAILYYVKGKSAEMVNILVDSLAVLAFVPGGVTAFGVHFEARLS